MPHVSGASTVFHRCSVTSAPFCPLLSSVDGPPWGSLCRHLGGAQLSARPRSYSLFLLADAQLSPLPQRTSSRLGGKLPGPCPRGFLSFPVVSRLTDIVRRPSRKRAPSHSGVSDSAVCSSRASCRPRTEPVSPCVPASPASAGGLFPPRPLGSLRSLQLSGTSQR